jgi:glycosyltransferase involved in cell wall biosynthesis
MKRILVIVFSDIQHDARVARQIAFLKGEYQVSVLAFGGKENDGYELLKIQKPVLSLIKKIASALLLLTRLYKSAFSILHPSEQAKQMLAGRHFDLVIANDVESLPWAFALTNGVPVLFDAHEYAPRHFEDRLSWRIFFQGFNTFLCREYIPMVAAMTTVGKGLALEYEKNFGKKPTVITNANWYYDIEPSPVTEKIRMIHHGGSTPSRKLELMIEMMKYLDERFTLDLMLIVPPSSSAKTRGYIDYLKSLAAEDKRIRFLPAIKSSEIVPFINQYDIGVFLLPPVNFNYANTLPNKLFDFIQARLAIAVGPTPEMAEIVDEYEIGVVAEDFTPQALAKKLGALTKEEIETFKRNSKRAAEQLNANQNNSQMNKIVGDLLRH